MSENNNTEIVKNAEIAKDRAVENKTGGDTRTSDSAVNPTKKADSSQDGSSKRVGYSNYSRNHQDRGFTGSSSDRVRYVKKGSPFKGKRGTFFRVKKECFFSKNHIDFVDYKDTDFLKRFLGKNGRILPRRVTGTKLIYQRMLATAVKRARYMGLLPFVGPIWPQEYYDQQNKEFLERKKQNQLREVREEENKTNSDKSVSESTKANEVVDTPKNEDIKSQESNN